MPRRFFGPPIDWSRQAQRMDDGMPLIRKMLEAFRYDHLNFSFDIMTIMRPPSVRIFCYFGASDPAYNSFCIGGHEFSTNDVATTERARMQFGYDFGRLMDELGFICTSSNHGGKFEYHIWPDPNK